KGATPGAPTTPEAQPRAAPPTAPAGEALHLPYSEYVASHKLTGQEPRIPAAVWASLSRGSALARICVDPEGRVTDLRFLRASAGLQEPLRAAVRTWRYRPFLSHGHAVSACFEMPFEFRRNR